MEQFYRIKAQILSENPEDGAMEKRKVEHLVMAANYADAETTMYKLFEGRDLTDFKYEIIKTKITELIYDDVLYIGEDLINGLHEYYFQGSADEGEGLYQVVLQYITTDEKTMKEKKTKGEIFVPATSVKDAYDRTNNYLSDSVTDYIIKSAKFDPADSILVTTAKYNVDQRHED